MKSIREVGFRKSFSFLSWAFFYSIYRAMGLPQLRSFYLSLLGTKVGKDTILMDIKFFNWQHQGFKGLKIGQECFLGDEVLIDLYNQVVLEDQVTLAQRVTILTHINVGFSNHPLQKYFPKESHPVIIKKGSVIGANSTILAGITIGEESMVAAGSVVTKDIPGHVLVAGVPAKIIRKLNE